MRLALSCTLLAVAAVSIAAPALAEGCSPVDVRTVDPAATSGRKAWIYEDTGAIARRPLAQWASATTSREVGPGKFVLEPPSLPYGQPVTIVSFERGHSMQGEYVVRLADQRERAILFDEVVPGTQDRAPEVTAHRVPDPIARVVRVRDDDHLSRHFDPPSVRGMSRACLHALVLENGLTRLAQARHRPPFLSRENGMRSTEGILKGA
ncbi:hypothetical protein [Methylobacterium radiotolerans]